MCFLTQCRWWTYFTLWLLVRHMSLIQIFLPLHKNLWANMVSNLQFKIIAWYIVAKLNLALSFTCSTIIKGCTCVQRKVYSHNDIKWAEKSRFGKKLSTLPQNRPLDLTKSCLWPHLMSIWKDILYWLHW